MWTEVTFWKLLTCTETKPIEEVSKAEDQKDELSVTDTPRYVIFSPTLILSLMHKKSDKSLFTISIGETFRNYSIIFTCILPDYVAREIAKEFWKNSHFENMRAGFLLRCQNSLW